MLNIEEIKAKYDEAFSCGDSDRMWDSLSDIPALIEQHEQAQQLTHETHGESEADHAK